MSDRSVIAVTAGDVAGIGPEIVVRALLDERVVASCDVVALCHPDILRRAAKLVGEDPGAIQLLETVSGIDDLAVGSSDIIHCVNPGDDGVLSTKPGVVSAAAGHAAFQYLTAATEFARAGTVDAIATAPLNKAALRAAGHNFPGHTEILATQCGVSSYAMMLHLPETRLRNFRHVVGAEAHGGGHGVSIAHVTLHTSVESVPGLLTPDKISERIHLMDAFLRDIGCDRRSIAICALNPHGGEDGLFGDEEQRLILPAIESAANQYNLTGPLPVDTLMRRAFLGEFDGIIAMYHDQGHIPVKLIGFDAAVNITLGLPIVRTSPTHGTAFDRAWNRETPADPSGMVEAILTAVTLRRSQ